MEKEIVWTAIAQKDFWDIIFYLESCWPPEVLDKFQHTLELKTRLLQKQPKIGYKSARHPRFRQTLITGHYKLIYSVTRNNIAVLRLKHTRMK